MESFLEQSQAHSSVQIAGEIIISQDLLERFVRNAAAAAV